MSRGPTVESRWSPGHVFVTAEVHGSNRYHSVQDYDTNIAKIVALVSVLCLLNPQQVSLTFQY